MTALLNLVGAAAAAFWSYAILNLVHLLPVPAQRNLVLAPGLGLAASALGNLSALIGGVVP